jgi:hypothetical protein
MDMGGLDQLQIRRQVKSAWPQPAVGSGNVTDIGRSPNFECSGCGFIGLVDQFPLQPLSLFGDNPMRGGKFMLSLAAAWNHTGTADNTAHFVLHSGISLGLAPISSRNV